MATPADAITVDAASGVNETVAYDVAPGQNAAPHEEPEMRLQMLSSDILKDFWEFVTTVRRTKSLSDRESAKLRGTWITPDLAVQKIHGWGLRSVRLLCVSAETDEQRERFRLFFQRDRRNLEGRLVTTSDPLDRERRILIKIPFASGSDGWVKHERRVLKELAALPGVPELGTPLYFEDVDVHAATYKYCDAPSIQEFLEQGRLMPQENTHSILSAMLTTLASAHSLGWLHTDLSAKDVLIAQSARAKDATVISGSSRAAGSSYQGPGIICGWSRAVQVATAVVPAPSIVEFAEALPTRQSNSAVEVSGADVSFDQEPSNDMDKAEEDESVASEGFELSAPSIYAAPEQFLALFAGCPCVAAATDVYRAAGITILATCGNAPFGVQGKPVARAAASDIDSLRRLCKEAILRRSEITNQQALPNQEEVQCFVRGIRSLISGQVNLSGCKAAELAPWFQKALAREMSSRFQTATEALEALDASWSECEERLANEYRAKEMSSERFVPPREERRQRLVFAPPPELLEMTVL